MNNEIKEILDNIRKCCNIDKDANFVVYQKQDILKVLDYITNLQEENEILRKNQKLTPEQRNHLHLELDEVLEIYKSRIETSIILLNELQEKIINNNYIVTDLDLDNIIKELGDN